MVTAVKVSEFDLTGAEQARLLEWAAGEGRGAVRARIVLACCEPGVVYARLADELGVSVKANHSAQIMILPGDVTHLNRQHIRVGLDGGGGAVSLDSEGVRHTKVLTVSYRLSYASRLP